MQKVDRLGWATHACFDAFGLRIGLRSNDPAFMREVEPFLPPLRRAAAGRGEVDRLYSVWCGRDKGRVRGLSLVYADAILVGRARARDLAYAALGRDLKIFVAQFATREVLVHAGVVAWNGAAIVLPGRSESGKSTMVASLLAAGAAYYSDEYAVVRDGRIWPYPAPLHLRGADGAGERWIEVDRELGATVGRRPLRPALVLLTEYQRGGFWREPRRLSTGAAVAETMWHVAAARERPAFVIDTLTQAFSGARAYQGARGDPADVIAWLRRQLCA